jgi:hypothetical protein
VSESHGALKRPSERPYRSGCPSPGPGMDFRFLGGVTGANACIAESPKHSKGALPSREQPWLGFPVFLRHRASRAPQVGVATAAIGYHMGTKQTARSSGALVQPCGVTKRAVIAPSLRHQPVTNLQRATSLRRPSWARPLRRCLLRRPSWARPLRRCLLRRPSWARPLRPRPSRWRARHSSRR